LNSIEARVRKKIKKELEKEIEENLTSFESIKEILRSQGILE